MIRTWGMTTAQGLALLAALGAGLLAFLLGRLAADLFLRRHRPDATAATRVAVRGAIAFAAAVFVFAPMAEAAGLTGRMAAFVRQSQSTAIVLVVALLALAFWDLAADRIASRATNLDPTADRLLVPVARKFVRFAIFLTAALVSLSFFVPNLGAIIAGLGIGGVALALAAKDSVENVLGSITILFDRPFAIGDWVRIDKAEGIVEEINLRSTRIRTFEDTVITLPNANLIRAAVENYGARRTRRQRLPIRIAGDAPPDRLGDFSDDLTAWAENRPGFVPDKTIVRIEGMSETGIAVLIQTHVEAETYADEMRLRDELLQECLRLLAIHGLFLMGAPRPTLEPGPNTGSSLSDPA